MSDQPDDASSRLSALASAWLALGAVAFLYAFVVADAWTTANAADRTGARLLAIVLIPGVVGALAFRRQPRAVGWLCLALAGLQAVMLCVMLAWGLGVAAVVVAVNLIFIGGLVTAAVCFFAAARLATPAAIAGEHG